MRSLVSALLTDLTTVFISLRGPLRRRGRIYFAASLPPSFAVGARLVQVALSHNLLLRLEALVEQAFLLIARAENALKIGIILHALFEGGDLLDAQWVLLHV